MTDQQIREAWAKACKSPTVSTNSDAAIEMVRALLAAGASEGQADQRQSFEFESWFDREFPMDPPPSRPKYQKTSVTNLMRAAWDARDAEIAALRERIAGMEKEYREAGVWDPDGKKFRTYRAENLNGKAMYVKETK